MLQQHSEASLQVRYETQQPIDAWLYAGMLTGLRDAFRFSVRRDAPVGHWTLGMQAITTGSLIAGLAAVADVVGSAIERRNALLDFMHEIQTVASGLMAGLPVTDLPYLKALVGLAQPVRQREAESVSISVTGDNNVVVIGKKEAKIICKHGPVAATASSPTNQSFFAEVFLLRGNWYAKIAGYNVIVALWAPEEERRKLKDNKRFRLFGHLSSEDLRAHLSISGVEAY